MKVTFTAMKEHESKAACLFPFLLSAPVLFRFPFVPFVPFIQFSFQSDVVMLTLHSVHGKEEAHSESEKAMGKIENS